MTRISYLLILVVVAFLSCGEKTAESADTAAVQTKKVQGKKIEVQNTAQANSYQASTAGHNTGGLEWLTIEEALEANQSNPKMMLIDVYTDWCGWCKVMDRKTFTDPEVQAYIKDHFYPVKFNAEQRSSIEFGGREYKFVPGGRRGHNALAAHLLNGRLGYPSFAYLNTDLRHMHVSAGFKKPDQFLAEMKNVVSSKG